MKYNVKQFLLYFSCGIVFVEAIALVLRLFVQPINIILCLIFLIPILTMVACLVLKNKNFIIWFCVLAINIIGFMSFSMSKSFIEYRSFEAYSMWAIIFFIFSIILAIFLPNLKRNYFLGIRTEDTCRYSEVWKRTHKQISYNIIFFLPAQFSLIFFLQDGLKFVLCCLCLLLPLYSGVIYARIITGPYIKREEQELKEQIQKEEVGYYNRNKYIK